MEVSLHRLLPFLMVSAVAGCGSSGCGGPASGTGAPNLNNESSGEKKKSAETRQVEERVEENREKRALEGRLREWMRNEKFQEVVDALIDPQAEAQKLQRAYALQMLQDPSFDYAYREISWQKLPKQVARTALLLVGDAAGNGNDCNAFSFWVEKQPTLADRHPLMHARCTSESLVEERASLIDAQEKRKRFSVQYRIAEIDLELGEKQKALASLRDLAVHQPASSSGKAAVELLSKNGVSIKKLEYNEKKTRLAALFSSRRSQQVLRETKLFHPQSRKDRRFVSHIKGMSFYRLKRYGKAADALKKSYFSGKTKRFLSDGFYAARALSRSQRGVKARRAYWKFAKSHLSGAERKLASRAYVLALKIDLATKGLSSKVRRNALALLRNDAVRTSDRFEIAWDVSLAALRKRELRQARQFLRKAEELARPTGMELGKVFYWQGRIAQLEADEEKADEKFQSALYVEPLHWYAQLAAWRRRQAGFDVLPAFQHGEDEAESEDRTVDESLSPDLSDVHLTEEEEYFSRLGMSELAAEQIEGSKLSREEKIRALTKIGAVSNAYRFARKHFRVPKLPLKVDNALQWHSLYPRPYLDLVKEQAAYHNVPLGYVYATMRQESGYQEKAVSRAGALGLLQVMPKTAVSLRSLVKLPEGYEFQSDDLLQGEIGIAFGVAEMRRSLDEYNNNIPFALAGYNAGHAKLMEWKRRFGTMELDLFVEHITYQETRNYIRRVSTHLAHYAYLTNPGKPWPALTSEFQ